MNEQISETESGAPQRRVAVFGLDGITFDLLQPWLDQGLLPNLASLFSSGATGRLTTTIPPVSASAWPSFFTGANPGQHGLVDFTYPPADEYQVQVTNGRTCAVPTLWDLVSQAGGRSGVVSMPMTFPPAPLNGFIVCSFLTPSPDSDYTFPSALKQELLDQVGPYPLHMSEKGRGTDPSIFVRAVKEMEQSRAKSVRYLLENKPWDLFMYVMETTDNLQHEVWHLMDESHPRYDAKLAAEVMPAIMDYYRAVDDIVGELIAVLPPETLIVVMSDHGFGPFHKFFHINNWLVQQGYLKFKRTPLGLLKRLAFRLGATPINALKWVTRLRLSQMRKNVKRGRGRTMLKRLFLSFDDVDWSRTKAFSVGNFGQVYLNVKGQRPQGVIDPQEVETVRQQLIDAALALRDPVDGNQVVQQVYRREDVFHGISSDRMPDLVFHTDRARYVSFGHADFGSNRVLEPSTGQTGHHHMVGVLGLKGPGVQGHSTIENASILDVAPTILHYMGLPVPRYMDGQVLTAALTPEFNQNNPIRYSDQDPDIHSAGHDFNADETDLVMQRLQDLGYVA